MRRLLFILIVLIASVCLSVYVTLRPGYVLIAYQPWMVQMPLWFAILSLLLLLGLFYAVTNSLDQLHFMWFRFKSWLHLRREHQSYSKTQHGMSALIEGRWSKAERLLMLGVNQSIEPLMNYLGAARAAHEQRAFDRSDDYIRKAYEVAPKAELAIGLTQAELEYSQDKFQRAAATLTHLQTLSPRHPRVLKLLEKIYVRLGDWKSLQALLPSMRKAKLVNAEQTEQFEKNIYCELLRSAAGNALDIKHIWGDIPRYYKKNTDIICLYVQELWACGAATPAEEELMRKTLNTTWVPALVRIYGQLTLVNINRQLVIVGAWLKMYGQQPELLLLLGKLCSRAQLWGKAKDYFERCLALGPNPEASLEYGELLKQLGNDEAAMNQYQRGLSMSLPHEPV